MDIFGPPGGDYAYNKNSTEYSTTYRKHREALAAAPWDSAMSGIYANYLQGLCHGRTWTLRRETSAICDGKGAMVGWECRLIVYGTQLFKEFLDDETMKHRQGAREFFGVSDESLERAVEDAARNAFLLLDNATINLRKGTLPRYDDLRTPQGRRTSWGSNTSSDTGSIGSSGRSSTSSARRETKKGRYQ